MSTKEQIAAMDPSEVSKLNRKLAAELGKKILITVVAGVAVSTIMLVIEKSIEAAFNKD